MDALRRRPRRRDNHRRHQKKSGSGGTLYCGVKTQKIHASERLENSFVVRHRILRVAKIKLKIHAPTRKAKNQTTRFFCEMRRRWACAVYLETEKSECKKPFNATTDRFNRSMETLATTVAKIKKPHD